MRGARLRGTARHQARRIDTVLIEVAVLIGLQASGKTTFYRQRLAATHAHVSKDNWPNANRREHRQLTLLTELLTAHRSVAVDNTNPSIADRRGVLAIAREYGAHTVAYWFPPDRTGAAQRNAARPPETRVPDVGFYATLKRLMGPHPAERFDSVYVVRFDGAGGFTVE